VNFSGDMRRLFTCTALSLATLVLIAPQGFTQSGRPQVSYSRFTRDELAVYQAFLADFRQGSNETLNAADRTDILQPDEGDYTGCMKGFEQSAPTNIVHRLTPEFATQNDLSIIDPKSHKIDDPQDAMLMGRSAEDATEAGFKSGVLTLSQVIFDKNHSRAALHYTFVCGRLCAQYETVVYEKRRGVWKNSGHSCGYGIS
jgi:hypothetical protein